MAAGAAAAAALPASLARSRMSLVSNRRAFSARPKCIADGSSQLQPHAAMWSRTSFSSQHSAMFCNSLRRSTGRLLTVRRNSETTSWQLPVEASWKQEILWTQVPIKESRKVAKELYHVQVDIASNPELKSGFTVPGQFVQVKFGTGKPAFLAIASPPKLAESSGVLEFLIKDVEGSTASQVCALPVGAQVEMSQVMGRGFPLDKLSPPEEYPTVLIFATGSGISPIRSVIEHGFAADKRKDVRLYFGASDSSFMAYQDRFEAWETSGVQVIPVFSDAGAEWEGEKGFVQAAYSKGPKPADPQHAVALLCGQKEMAEEVTRILLEDGLAADKVLLNF
eukprot:TRINITY_DN845_c0_g1_i1.p1 TRINITY_DN845_c0_g1~~TRINITY_DN845_c0_g1_i1.p1  ORF type:complete len:337 (-),score=51.97 TRINITY_DN845_c0_g1_i1:890-1900(-)